MSVQIKSKKNEIMIAIIGLIGVLGTAVFSNFEKITSSKNGNIIKAVYSGYRPTGNFETEYRYFREVTGDRKFSEEWQQQVEKQIKTAFEKDYINEFPQYAEELKNLLNSIIIEWPSDEERFKMELPVYQRYYTTEEIQELNKFYSTETMQSMVKKRNLILLELDPVYQKIIERYTKQITIKVKELVKDMIK